MAKALIIAAPWSGSGKTVVTLGLLRALRNRGIRVASAKVGPDYIDPPYHEAASGRPCFNLDPWAMSSARIRCCLDALAVDADLVIIEGVMGLFDGPESAKASTADLASDLSLPVILVLDCAHMGQSAAAVVRGFDHPRPLAGLILNRIASMRHERLALSGMKESCPMLGAIPRSGALTLPSRHLGLVQASENPGLDALLEEAAAIVGSRLDLDALLKTALPLAGGPAAPAGVPALGKRIALARDRAFAFIYPHLLEEWSRQGSAIVSFSPLADEEPDWDADAVFLPGGYPELHASKLSRNRRFIAGLRAAAERGALVYGECGGFMALGRYLIDGEGARHEMAGLLPLGTSFADPQLHLGYRALRHRSPLPFPAEIKGHEFHYSAVDWQGEAAPLFEARDAAGTELGAIGMVSGNVMGSYAHII